MKIYKRADSSFWWVAHGRKWRKATPLRTSKHTKHEVEKLMNSKGEQAFFQALSLVATKVSLNDIKIKFNHETDIRNRNKNSYANSVKSSIQNFIQYIGEDKTPSTIRTIDIENYLMDRIKEGKALSTAKKDKAYIGLFFKVAISMNAILKEANPFDDIRPKLFGSNIKSTSKRINKPIPKQYMQEIFQCDEINPTYRLFWRIMYYTGFDPVDALNLTPANINNENDTIFTNRGKNDKETFIIPIADSLKNHDLFNLGDKFPQKLHKGKLRESLKILRKYLKKFGYNGYVSFKCLRHTFNQNLAENGIDGAMRTKVLGQTGKNTNRTYTHQNNEMLKEAMRNF